VKRFDKLPLYPNGEDCVQFSPQERRVADTIANADSSKVGAFKLGIYESTYATHLYRMMTALDVTRAEFFRFLTTFPESIAGFAVPTHLHPDGCYCLAPYCVSRRVAHGLQPAAGLPAIVVVSPLILP
jgi:hypothetical protein